MAHGGEPSYGEKTRSRRTRWKVVVPSDIRKSGFRFVVDRIQWAQVLVQAEDHFGIATLVVPEK